MCHPTVRDCVFLSVAMLLAIWGAYVFDLSPNVSSAQREITPDEAIALVGFLFAGLFLICLLRSRREIARRAQAEHRAHELALSDSLTGLANRRQFEQELRAAIAAPPRADGAHAVFLLDLNEFKQVNDMYGHAVGDEVLMNFALRAQRAVRERDLVARLGGDEFAILARQLAGPEEATNIASRVTRELDEAIVVNSIQHPIGVSIGIALIPQDGQTSEEIMRKADIAMYRAKAEPVSASRFFEAEMDARIRQRNLIKRDLRTAINEGTVQPYFQPIVDLRTREVVAFEALARWHHPILGNVPPDRFIPIAESCNLLNQLTDHLLREAARAACTWPQDITLSFNISPSQLKDHTFGLRILAILGEAGLSPHRVEIEITESALVRDLEGAQELLGALRQAGIRIALDDFGTGYSGLYHLRNLKINKLKIDRNFVVNMERDPEGAAFMRALLGFGHGLGMTVTAEGVEQSTQANALAEQGCEQAQGFFYARAMPAAETIKFLQSTNASEAECFADDRRSASNA